MTTDLRASQAAFHRAFGLHSNIPACCVEAWIADDQRTALVVPAHLDALYDYIPCDDCLARQYAQPLHRCTSACPVFDDLLVRSTRPAFTGEGPAVSMSPPSRIQTMQLSINDVRIITRTASSKKQRTRKEALSLLALTDSRLKAHARGELTLAPDVRLPMPAVLDQLWRVRKLASSQSIVAKAPEQQLELQREAGVA